MTAKYTLYSIETGEIDSCVTCPERRLPPEGPLFEGSDLAVVHGEADPNEHRVHKGKIKPIYRRKKRDKERRAKVHLFRQRRTHLMGQWDYKFNVDYPLPTSPSEIAKREELIRKRRATREINIKNTDPDEALRLLDEIWSDQDVE